MTSFFFSSNPISRRVSKLEDAAVALEESMGLTPEHKASAKAVLDGIRGDRTAESAGVATANGKRFEVEGVVQNGDVREVHMHRRTESGAWEKVIAREERVSDGTFVSKGIDYAR